MAREARNKPARHRKKKPQPKAKPLTPAQRERFLHTALAAQQSELDCVTRLLCGVLTKQPELAGRNKTLAKWWAAHQRWDKKRAKRSRKK